ncbi:two-component response regulator [Sulfurimonas gotlandica GD1]|uniref:Two-component response regulator n=1 Tax=Sulfurimonas gotlandica (strain DSM 19862 / JCM 16533 / GD1) TaxID=929558 RepID=B6BGJ7_SULGG|nr:response regulator transcription factor [Sulfurimonas gotlandica]EDZ63501.1 two component transcriptional regulator, winged helix family [Sulfurimonas gotlandica GD1]EHP29625.1 two-component response regulator [Sulfurimonas gotlandica GD1]
MKILLLEDDTVLADILVDFLQEEYTVTHTYSMKKALVLSEEINYDLYIFDINVPDGDGISLLKELRSFNDETPTIFITAFHDTQHLKKAFESGANDFIKKPFDLEELTQRIENIKRHFGLSFLVQIAKDLEFDTQNHILKSENSSQHLSNKESMCLHYLYKNRHRVVSVDELLQNLWEYDEMPSGDAVRTLIKELRKHLGKEHILNIRGEGYRFE